MWLTWPPISKIPLEDPKNPAHAKDLEKDLQEFIRSRVDALPPSEQKKVSTDVYQMLQTVASGKKLFIGTYNMMNPRESYQVESILNNVSLKVLSTSMTWSPTGELIYQITVEMSEEQYKRARGKYYETEKNVLISGIDSRSRWEKVKAVWRALVEVFKTPQKAQK